MAAHSDWPLLTVARLAKRDPRRCIHCGAVDGLTVQHRAAKGMGGSLAAEHPANGVILCWALNVAAEADTGAAELCRAFGWKISRYADPERVPVYDAVDGRWYRLTDVLSPEGRVPVP